MRQLQAFLQWLIGHPHLIIIILFFMGSVFARIAKQYNAVRKERERRAAIERAEFERLRTGQREDAPPMLQRTTPHDPTHDPVAEARRRKMDEMRRGQPRAAQGRAASSASVRAPTTRSTPQPAQGVRTQTIRLPGGIVLEVPIAEPEPRSGARPRPAPSRRSAAKADSRERQVAAKPEPASASAYEVQPKPAPGVHQQAGRPSGGLAALLGSADRTALRRALVLREILGPPRSMDSSL